MAELRMNASGESSLLAPPSSVTQDPASFRRQLATLGKNFRTTQAQRREFVEAFISHRNDNRFQDGEQDYADYVKHIESVIEKHPSLSSIPMADLVALRVWTSNDYDRVQDSLEEGARAFPESVPFARSMISALNALPEEFTYSGRVFTGENQSVDWVSARYAEGAVRTDWRFFASSEAKESAWQNQSVDIETISSTGKRISMFSTHPEENEILFPPGTRFFVDKVEVQNKDGKNHVQIEQHELRSANGQRANNAAPGQ